MVSGRGTLQVTVSNHQNDRTISLFYYKPKNFSRHTKVVMVIPGSGRNASDYRDSWIENAENYNLLVVSPKYPETDYNFSQYHLGGVVKDLKLQNPKIEKANGRINKYRMADEDISFSYNNDPTQYLFHDFDKIFEEVREAFGTSQQNYDLFGHSAGGQILHRYVLFKPKSKAKRIVAANSGFYTHPNKNLRFPLGLMHSGIESQDSTETFSCELVVMLGEKDDAQETRGIMLHTPTVDKRGLGRVERGRYFYNRSQQQAKELGLTFNWKINIVKGVGHDYKKMGKAAAAFLYAQE